jgi:hypothetical protein
MILNANAANGAFCRGIGWAKFGSAFIKNQTARVANRERINAIVGGNGECSGGYLVLLVIMLLNNFVFDDPEYGWFWENSYSSGF